MLYNVAYFDGEKFYTSSGKDVTKYVEKIKNTYIEIVNSLSDVDDDLKNEAEIVISRILNRIQYLIKKNDYENEEEVRIFFLREGSEDDIKETKKLENAMPRLYINLKIETKIKKIILGPKIGNGYDKVPYIYIYI